MNEITKQTPITYIDGDTQIRKDDCVIREAHVAVYIDEKQVLSAPCLDTERELFLYGALFIQKGIFPEEVKRIEWKGLTAFVYLNEEHTPVEPALGIVQTPLEPLFSSQALSLMVEKFQRLSSLFQNTGAVHVAALSTAREILYWDEDISRRTAIDKVIGAWLLSESRCGAEVRDRGKGFRQMRKPDIPNDCFLITSGRISHDIVMRAIRIGVPLIVSVAPPSDRAIETAHKHKLTLIGFARPPRMNIYTHSVRVF